MSELFPLLGGRSGGLALVRLGLVWLCLGGWVIGQTGPSSNSSYRGPWAAQIGQFGWIVVSEVHFQPKKLWWMMDSVYASTWIVGSKATVGAPDGKGSTRIELVFDETAQGELRLLPGGILPDPLPSPFAGLVLQRISQAEWNALIGPSVHGTEYARWHEHGELRALPSEWPGPLAEATARIFYDQPLALMRVLALPTLRPEFLHEVLTWPALGQYGPSFAANFRQVVASNPACDRLTLTTLWETTDEPTTWSAAMRNPNAAPEWLGQFADRVMHGTAEDQRIAGADPTVSPDLIERIAERAPFEAASAVSHNPNASPDALETIYRRSLHERGAGPDFGPALAANARTPGLVLQALASDALNVRAALLLSALAGNPSLSRELHEKVADARLVSIIYDGQPRFGGISPLIDPYLPRATVIALISLPIPTIRAELAANPGLTDDELRLLASDRSARVSETAVRAWAIRHPLQPLNPGAGAGRDTQCTAALEIREMILSGHLDEAVAAWRRVPSHLRGTLIGVVSWEQPAQPLNPLLDFAKQAEPSGGPLATSLLSSVLLNAPEQLPELASRGLLGHVEPFQPLSQAIAAGRLDAVGCLLEAGLDPNCQGGGGMRPLMLAARSGNDEMIRLLLRHAADRHLTDGYGRTAIDFATVALKPATISLLVDGRRDAARLKGLKQELTPAAPGSGFVGRWTNQKEGPALITVEFDENGAFVLATGQSVNRGKWREDAAGRATGTYAVTPEPIQPFSPIRGALPVIPRPVHNHQPQPPQVGTSDVSFTYLSDPPRLQAGGGAGPLLYPEK